VYDVFAEYQLPKLLNISLMLSLQLGNIDEFSSKHCSHLKMVGLILCKVTTCSAHAQVGDAAFFTTLPKIFTQTHSGYLNLLPKFWQKTNCAKLFYQF
jgi:hypothetical protein